MTPSLRWAFGSFFFLYFAYVGLVSPYASLFFLERGFSVIEIAALMSMLQITRIVGPFSWGWLSDYLSNRISIIRFCASLAALIFLCIYFLQDYIVFFIWIWNFIGNWKLPPPWRGPAVAGEIGNYFYKNAPFL